MNKFNYETPVGTFSTYEEASNACERCDLDPCENVKPVELPALSPSTVDVCWISEYGLTQKLTRGIRCF